MDYGRQKIAFILKKKVRRIISKWKLNDAAGMVRIYKHILFILLLFLMKKIMDIYL